MHEQNPKQPSKPARGPTFEIEEPEPLDPSVDPSRITSAVYVLLCWIRDTRPDLFYTIVSPIQGHRLLPQEEK